MIYETKEIRVDNHIYDVKSLSKYHPGGELFVKHEKYHTNISQQYMIIYVASSIIFTI